jgi:hypothetical protein
MQELDPTASSTAAQTMPRARIDEVLKELLRDPNSVFRRRIAGNHQVVAELDKEQIRIQTRLADLVWRLDDGCILHIEIQSTNDPRMAFRMAEYGIAISDRHGEKLIQIVIYVGSAPLTMPTTVSLAGHTFAYDVIDIHELTAADLLASGSLTDALLSILADHGQVDERGVVREVVQRIAALPPEQRRRALTILHQFTGLRPKLMSTIKEELQTMPITYDDFDVELYEKELDENPFTGRIRAQAARKAAIQATINADRSTLRRLLHKRFGPLPESLEARIANATQPELSLWLDNFVTANSVGEVFDSPEKI